jgi:hypothetical protein
MACSPHPAGASGYQKRSRRADPPAGNIVMLDKTTKTLSPGQVAPDGLNQPVPRWLWRVLAALSAALAVMLVLNWNVLHVYRKYFLSTAPHMQMPWSEFSASMDEAAAKSLLMGVPLYCFDDATSLGQRSCYTAVQKVDGYPALTVALFFRSGHLALATVHVPWWGHEEAVERLSGRLGASQLARAGGSNDELRQWTVPGGVVDMNTDRSLNVLQWSAVVWTPRTPRPVLPAPPSREKKGLQPA